MIGFFTKNIDSASNSDMIGIKLIIVTEIQEIHRKTL